ncbi:MAG: FG-GAP repeat protein, partial [Myxococcales bacterium]|nr:FG-GAP repeat protein [Myxococcales bacterium]
MTACDDPSTLSIDLAPVDPALADDEIPEKPDAALVADALEAGLLDDEAEAGAIAALGLDLAAPARPSAIALQAGDRFGFATAFGDFDGDGDLELAVSAIHKATGTIPDVGAVQLYEYTGYYVSTLQETYTLTQPGLTEPQPYEKFGYALAVGDYDGDGDDDLAVGTPDDDDRGAVFVFLGGPGGLTYAGKLTAASVPGESRHVYHWFGAALAAGDFNNDGRDELVVGAPSWTDEPGAAYLFRGTASGLVGATALREGAIDAVEPPCYGICFFPPTLGVLAPGTSFGAALAAGDLDGDDIDDLIVGAPG